MLNLKLLNISHSLLMYKTLMQTKEVIKMLGNVVDKFTRISIVDMFPRTSKAKI